MQVKYGIQSEQVHYWVHMGLGNPYLPIPNHLVPPCTAYGKSFSCLILLHPSCDSVTVLQCSCPARAAPPSSKLLELQPLSGSRSCSLCEKAVPGRSPNNNDPELVMQWEILLARCCPAAHCCLLGESELAAKGTSGYHHSPNHTFILLAHWRKMGTSKETNIKEIKTKCEELHECNYSPSNNNFAGSL